jgi:hypothetical protein
LPIFILLLALIVGALATYKIYTNFLEMQNQMVAFGSKILQRLESDPQSLSNSSTIEAVKLLSNRDGEIFVVRNILFILIFVYVMALSFLGGIIIRRLNRNNQTASRINRSD